MSKWYTVEDEDIDIDDNNRQVNVLVTEDETGNIYAVLTFEQIKNIFAEMLKDYI